MKKILESKIYLCIVLFALILLNIFDILGVWSLLGDVYMLVTDSYPKAGETVINDFGAFQVKVLTEDDKPEIEVGEISCAISWCLCIATLILISRENSDFRIGTIVTIALGITILLNLHVIRFIVDVIYYHIILFF